MTCGLPTALSVMVSVPVRNPFFVGAKISPIEQKMPTLGGIVIGGRVVQWLSTVKSPVATTLLTIQFPSPRLSKLMKNSAWVPTRRSLDETASGKKIWGVPPLPENGIVCCAIAALSVRFIVPKEALLSIGVNVSCTAQVLPGAIAPQLCVTVTVGSDELTEVNCSGALPQFFTFNVCEMEVFTKMEPKFTNEGLTQTDGAGFDRSTLAMKVCQNPTRGFGDLGGVD